MDSEKNQTPLTKRHCTQHSNHLTKDSGFVPILRNSSTVPTTIVEKSSAIAPQISSPTPNSSTALQTTIKGTCKSSVQLDIANHLLRSGPLSNWKTKMFILYLN